MPNRKCFQLGDRYRLDNDFWNQLLIGDFDMYGPDQYENFTNLLPLIEYVLVQAVRNQTLDMTVGILASISTKCQNAFDANAEIRKSDVELAKAILFTKLIGEYKPKEIL